MVTVEPLPRWYRWVGLGLLAGLVGFVTWRAWPRWTTVAIDVVEVDGATLTIQATWCNQGDIRTAVQENDSAVTVTVSLRDYDPGNRDDCGDPPLTASLDEPLGDRALVDGSDDHVLTCAPVGAERQECVR